MSKDDRIRADLRQIEALVAHIRSMLDERSRARAEMSAGHVAEFMQSCTSPANDGVGACLLAHQLRHLCLAWCEINGRPEGPARNSTSFGLCLKSLGYTNKTKDPLMVYRDIKLSDEGHRIAQTDPRKLDPTYRVYKN